jgi:hypothetical protein
MLTLTAIAAGLAVWVAAVAVYEGRKSAACSAHLRRVMSR